MKFSERLGFRQPPRSIQTDGMTAELRNSLWNVLDLELWSKLDFVAVHYGTPEIQPYSSALWAEFFKKPIDTRPRAGAHILGEIRRAFFHDDLHWSEIYDFLEWTINFYQHNPRVRTSLTTHINYILERELSGFRFVNDVFTPITDAQEVAALDLALADNDFPGVRAHLAAALRLLSDRKTPDYRNSIKESISAVESMAQVVSGHPKATLGDALVALEKRTTPLHGALKKGFSSLYGYTSDEGGIRHAMLEEPDLTVADAKFFLLSCTSFINYLKSKM
jgi:hypothetical protein